MGIPLRVLIVEDSVDDAELVLRQLRRAGYDPVSERVQTAEEMKTALARAAWDLVVCDYTMPQFDAPTALNLLNQSGRDLPFIVVSGSIGEDIAVTMMKSGAHDYILKQNLTRFVPALQRELREAENRRQQRLTEQARQRLEIERAELLERLKQENEDLTALTQVTANAISTLDLDELLRVLLGRVIEVMHADTGTILIADGADLQVRASAGAVNLSDSTHVKHVGECFAGSVASRLKPVYVADAAVDPLITDPLIRERGIRSMLGVPLKRHGALIGVLHVDWLTVRPCRDREVQLLEIAAERCAAAIYNAQVYQEAKRSAAALTESEENFRQLTAHINEVFWMTDVAKNQMIYISPAYETIWGRTCASVYASPHNWLDAIHPEDRERVAQSALNNQTTGTYDEAYRIVRPDGTIRWIHDRGFPVRNKAGKVYRIAGVAQDITERKQAEEAESRLVAILEATPDLVSIADPEGRLVYLNRAGRKTLGLDELTDLSGYNLQEFHDAANAQAVMTEGIPTAMRDGAWSGETELVALDGHATAVSQVILVHKAPNGTVTFLSTIARDITGRKRAEESLRLQSAALKAAANSIVITDRNGTIEWVNPAFTALTYYRAEDAIGKNPRELSKSGLHDQLFYRDLWNTILAGHVWHGEVTNRRKDGSLYSEEQSITSVKDARGELTHFVAIGRDLTEQKRLEAQLLQAQKMEVVGRLASGIAHDFNNLLTVINGTAELVLMDLNEDDTVRADLQAIGKAGMSAAALTRQLLAFSRKQIMKPVALNLNSLLADLKDMLQRLIGEDVALMIVPAKDVGRVMADHGQIEQVVMNLAVNARDAMANGGTLTIETRNVVLDEASAAEHPSLQPGPHVRLTVSDTGGGMDEATRLQIFDPFFTTKELGTGTGLGLSTVYGIVRQSGGDIGVSSELGMGATFTIYLPLIGDVVHKGPPAPTVPSLQRAETVLIVDDDEAVCRLTKRILQSAGYTVLTASSGGEAVLLLERHDGPVHLMLTDMVMPQVSGRELATQLTNIRPRMKVLYMSGYTDDTILRRGLLDQAAHFIAKPYTTAELTRTVREVLDS
jgi:PAS domain S-box-containing protein